MTGLWGVGDGAVRHGAAPHGEMKPPPVHNPPESVHNPAENVVSHRERPEIRSKSPEIRGITRLDGTVRAVYGALP
ncbi:hypothetical protein GCM10027568_26080 [Humibacter soli]